MPLASHPQGLHEASQHSSQPVQHNSQAMPLALHPQGLHDAYQRSFPFHQTMQIPISMEQTMNIFAYQNKIFDIRNKSCSLSNYAVNLMLFFFTNEELTRPDVNVNGKNSNGNSKVMQPLDPIRINQIRSLCMESFQVPLDQQMKQWVTLHKAMSKKMSFLKKIKSLSREI